MTVSNSRSSDCLVFVIMQYLCLNRFEYFPKITRGLKLMSKYKMKILCDLITGISGIGTFANLCANDYIMDEVSLFLVCMINKKLC